MTDIVEDAELLALGQQLEQIEQRWIDRRIKDIRHQDDDPELEIWANISDQLFSVAERILQRKARTRLGFALQARTTSMVFSEYWLTSEFFDEDGVDGYIRLFLEAACSFADTLPVPIAAERVVHPDAFPMASERV